MQTNKHSIRKQYPLIFGLLLFGAILLVAALNFMTLERFYVYHKEKVLIDAYIQIDAATSNEELTTDDFEKVLHKISSVNNIEVIILDSDTNTIKSTEHDTTMLTNRLLGHIFEMVTGSTAGSAEEESSGEDTKETVNNVYFYQDSRIQIQKMPDKRLDLDYLELWGVLSSSNLILMRTPIQSMQEAALYANRILVVCGFFIAIIGFFVIWYVSSRLTQPIIRLVSISEKMTRLDFSEKFKPGDGNEIDELGNHINMLSENLERTIIELKTANTQLQKDIDKKNELDEMRRDFVSNVSHELKTPIALIQGYAEGLKDCVNDDEDSREFYCDVIMDEAGRMNRMVKSLLELNELEYGQDNVDMAHFDIVELIYNVASSMDIMVKSEGISLELPDRGNKLLVWSDEFKIEHIVSNYLSNAIHYAKGDKIIRVTITRKEDGLARVGVFNTGDNIPDDVIPNLWVKFYKADKARTREYGGSGIGLSIVKASMEALGRSFGVENMEDGVEFWFEVDA